MTLIFQSNIQYHYYYYLDLVLEKVFMMSLLYRMNEFLIQKFLLQHNRPLQLIHAIHHPVVLMLSATMESAVVCQNIKGTPMLGVDLNVS